MQPLIICLVLVAVVNSQNVCDDSLTTNLPDSAFSASTDYTTKDPVHNYAPYRGRLDAKTDNNPKDYKVGGWVALTLDSNQWLQVDLGSPAVMQTVSTEGRDPDPKNGCCNQWVTQYGLEYSLDGSNWTSVVDSTGADKIFTGNTDTDTPVTNQLDCPIIAQYVRVKPMAWNKHIALRMDVNGCYIGSGGPSKSTQAPTTQTTQTTQTTLKAGVLSSGQCVSDCSSKSDGFYQSCQGCDVYVKCFQNVITDNNPCPPGTVWNDNVKFCDKTSPTCSGPTTPPGPTTTTMKPGQLSTGACVSDCSSTPDGYYQSCAGCKYYARCYGGTISDKQPCPPGTVWNDNVKFCDKTSPTCVDTTPAPTTSTTSTTTTSQPSTTLPTTPVPTTTPTTTTTTTTTPTTTPTTTTPTTTTPTTTTPTTTTPTTTTPTTTTPTTTTPTTTTPTTTKAPTTTPTTTSTPKPTQPPTTPTPIVVKPNGKPKRCVRDCKGLPNGDYQSCKGCNFFVSCSSGYTYDGKPCPGATVWNDDYKYCDHTSPTCH